MKVVTRAAPGATGPFHFGSLYNALLNYVFAKKHDGTFFLRLDAPHKTGPSIRFEREIEETLRVFGLIPDFVVKQTDRQDIYKKQLEDLLGRPGVYFCQCSNQDITKRLSEGSKAYSVDRHDKYPPPCTIKRVQLLGEDPSQNLASEAQILASSSAPGFAPDNVVHKAGEWKPFGPWYYGKTCPVLTFKWSAKVAIRGLEILWSRCPAKSFEVLVDDDPIAQLNRTNRYCWRPPEVDCKTVRDVVSFGFKETKTLTIVPTDLMRVVQREYVYDRYCRDQNLSLDLNDAHTIVRRKCKGFPDVVLWNGEERKVDLAFRSAIDDKEFGTTHSIRGLDTEVFSQLESKCSDLIDYQPYNEFHGLILKPDKYKFAKSTGGRDVNFYLEKGASVEQILSCLAWKTGLITERRKMSLDSLVHTVRFPASPAHTVIDEKCFLEECLES
ncbi:MAG: hypothetical protein KAV87_41710 [Desulfobacteraceae bacterium]|nr:hypothetical protein [Desulfobacteraceae bacterium]